MTLRSSKNHPITLWSTRLWKQRKWVAASLVFSASLLPASAQELATTGDEPGRRSLTPLESLSSDSAHARWSRAKARYQPLAADTLTADLGTEAVPTAAAATTQQPFRPIPLDMDEPVAAAQAPELPLLPDGADEPAWVVTAAPAPAPLPAKPAAPAPRVLTSRSSSGFPAAGAVPRQPAPPMPVIEQSQGRLDRSLPAEPLRVAAAQVDTVIPPLPETQGAAGGAAPATRPVRRIGEIQPFYDKSVDEDIREYAEARASEYDVHFSTEVYAPRMFPDTAMAWEPSNLYHYPLYFEDVALERYGHTYPFVVQPFVSVAKFSGQLLALPYQMTLDPVDKPMYALGYYRPGEVAPKLKYQIPLNAQAAATQAAVTTGLFYLIP